MTPVVSFKRALRKRPYGHMICRYIKRLMQTLFFTRKRFLISFLTETVKISS